MRLVQTIPPQAEPIDLNEAKAHLRLDISDDDATVKALIQAARDYAEKYTGRQLVTATWRVDAPGFGCMTMPVSPGITIDAIAYTDSDGAAQTLAGSDYKIDTTGLVWRLRPAWGVSWPAVRSEVDAVRITHTVGYATPFTANADTSVLTLFGRAPVAGEIVRLSNSGGALPQPLAIDTPYHVRDVSGQTCKLAATAGGDAIELIDIGQGIHFVGAVPATIRQAMLLLIGHYYENRESVIVGTAANQVPMTVENLLNMSKDWRLG